LVSLVKLLTRFFYCLAIHFGEPLRADRVGFGEMALFAWYNCNITDYGFNYVSIWRTIIFIFFYDL